MRAVKFLRSYRMYQPGETAGFDDALAATLIKSGVAVDPSQSVSVKAATADKLVHPEQLVSGPVFVGLDMASADEDSVAGDPPSSDAEFQARDADHSESGIVPGGTVAPATSEAGDIATNESSASGTESDKKDPAPSDVDTVAGDAGGTAVPDNGDIAAKDPLSSTAPVTKRPSRKKG